MKFLAVPRCSNVLQTFASCVPAFTKIFYCVRPYNSNMIVVLIFVEEVDLFLLESRLELVNVIAMMLWFKFRRCRNTNWF